MPSTPDKVTVGAPHWPGYGTRNHGESDMIFNLLSTLPGWPGGRVSVRVSITQIVHIATIVSKTCNENVIPYSTKSLIFIFYTYRKQFKQREPSDTKAFVFTIN